MLIKSESSRDEGDTLDPLQSLVMAEGYQSIGICRELDISRRQQIGWAVHVKAREQSLRIYDPLHTQENGG